MKMTRGWSIVPACIFALPLARCGPSPDSVAAEVVNVPADGCVAPEKTRCNNGDVFVEREWLTTDCKGLPIKGLSFGQCAASKIYQFSTPGRGTAQVQSYGAMSNSPQASIVVNYTKEIGGHSAGVTSLDEAGLNKRLRGNDVPVNGKVGRLGEDFESITEQRQISHGRVISHTGDVFVYEFDAGIDHCRGFLSYGPAEWPGYLRQWAVEAYICDHAGHGVSLDEITKLQSQLSFR